MITTKFGSSVKWVAMLDEKRGITTVVGYQKQVHTFAIKDLVADEGGIVEIRTAHQKYLQMREEQRAPEVKDGMIV